MENIRKHRDINSGDKQGGASQKGDEAKLQISNLLQQEPDRVQDEED